jgi:hypothetical protein
MDILQIKKEMSESSTANAIHSTMNASAFLYRMAQTVHSQDFLKFSFPPPRAYLSSPILPFGRCTGLCPVHQEAKRF